MILDFVNIANLVGDDFKESLPDDYTGEITIKYLEKVRKIANRINSNHPSSLGLHPIVYFYSQDGRHKVASFYATISFVMKLEATNQYQKFIAVRSSFEYFLLKYDYLIQQIVRKYRGAFASYPFITEFYFAIINELSILNTNIDIVAADLVKTDKYNYLSLMTEKELVISSEFSSERKSAVYINQALDAAPKCKICNGFIHRNSISIDHIIRKQDGGLGSIENGQLSHPFCNTGIKN